MTKKERDEWMKSAIACFYNPDCEEACMWRCLLRYYSGYEYLNDQPTEITS